MTPEGYMSYATYKDSGRSYNLPIGPQGSPTSSILYPIDYPDYAVCLLITRNATGEVIFQKCVSSGVYIIHYGGNNSVTMDKQKNFLL